MDYRNRRTGPGRGLRGLATRVSATRARQRTTTSAPGRTVDAAVAPEASTVRPDPVLRWKNPGLAPDGDFSACAVPNAQLRVHGIPDRGETWDVVSSFALSYDGYAYWDDVCELATRRIRSWTRLHTLPTSIDEVRACLFYEQRRWHHFGEDPNGRGELYVWALLDTLRNLVAARSSAEATMGRIHLSTSVPVRARGTIRSFLDDDPGYLAWVTGHGDGFVVNADRTLSPNSLILHRAACSFIGGPTRPGRTRTANYRKVCSSDVDALVTWCRTDIGTDPGCCHRCRPLSSAPVAPPPPAP
ncbi:MAG TPA: hypothetical protein VN791_04235 [Acidimicrobiales bacterium]|nr:hypothetical protein [Acidimicrobiales bacterium]